ncbi:hypothetical protein [Halobacterium hubeiense]|uniref:hypothetical protein n=1 Tax=Halobacterium hubeiense TaxID=1407499 RepID=UPI00117A1F8A|nr:hypothetical protein [Halobacterium hubeiense]
MLYDELWFYDPVVCPENMRELDFVKFVTDQYDEAELAALYERDERGAQSLVADRPGHHQFPYSDWEDIVTTAAPFATHDDHGQGGDVEIGATPRPSISNSKFDFFVSEHINAEYVANTPLTEYLSDVMTAVEATQTDAQIVDRAVCSGIPNYISPDGPPLELIDDFRHHHHLSRFRSEVEDLIDDPVAVERERQRIEEAAAEMRHEAVNSVSDPNRIYLSAARLAVNRVPLVGKATGWIFDSQDLLEAWDDVNRFGWASFYADLEASVREYEH